MNVQPLPDETATLSLRHRVHVVHATTGGPIDVDAGVDPAPPAGWAVEVVGADVLFKAWEAAPDPDGPLNVALRVRDRELAARLDVPDPDPDAGEVAPDATVTIAGPLVTHAFDPAPSVLEVVLRTPDDDPRVGRTVQARGASGALVALGEDGTTGIYRSAATTWSSDFHPLEVVVDGDPIRRIAIDTTRSTTRVRLIDPT
jgi:hypothetical protein